MVIVVTIILAVILVVGVMVYVKKHLKTKKKDTVELNGYSTRPDKVTL